jgi:hypothetical protein
MTEPTKNALGSTVKSAFECMSDRYKWDAECSADKGWEQYDTSQDASYFGVWVHLEERKVLTFAEGDITLVTAPDVETMRAEMKALAEFYGDPPPFAISYDEDEHGKWTRTEHYAERPALEPEPEPEGGA